MDKTIITRTKADVARALYLIEEATFPLEIRIKDHHSTRSDKQNRLAFVWYSEAEKQLKDGVSQRAFCKLHFGVGILKAGDSKVCRHFAEQYDAVVKPLDYAVKLAVMLPPFELPVTSLMTIKQYAEYLTAMDHHYHSVGVVLPHPDDLYMAALLKD